MSTVEGDETNSSSARLTETDEKIVFLLKAAGGAPILKKKKWALPRSKTIGHIAEFLKKYMQLDIEQQKQLFLYVNQTFAPAIDTTIGAVNDCFSSDGTLVLHYTLTPAWG
jgi:ubiquitin-like protein ATG12